MMPGRPLFVVGYPRSGTTLLQGLLATQEGWYSFPESHYFSVVERALSFDGARMVRPESLPAGLDRLHEKTGVRFAPALVAGLTRQARAGKLGSRDIFEALLRYWLDEFHPGWPARLSDWIEKTPTHANWLFRIHEVYPEARFVHLVRHPVPAIASRIAKFPFNRTTPPEHLARHWMALQDNVEHFREAHPGRIRILRYEDLAENPESVLAATSDFLGFAFDFARLERFSDAVARYILPAEPWKADHPGWPPVNTNRDYFGRLDSTMVTLIEAVTAPGMARHNYAPFAQVESTGAAAVCKAGEEG
ncbi:MAG: sulfotransferase [Acidobacteriota bacterium]